MSFIEEIEKEKIELEKLLYEIENKKRKDMNRFDGYSKEYILNSKLKCTNKNGNSYYYIDDKYIRKSNLSEVKLIAQSQYYNKLIHNADVIIKELDRIKRVYDMNNIYDVYNKMKPARKAVIEPIDISNYEKSVIWENEPFETKGIREENIMYRTERGEKVRSKSEKIIADTLFRYDIAYRYEAPLSLYNGSYNVLIYPDFTTMNRRNGRIYYWEHLGLMDNAEYSDRASARIGMYEQNDILLGDKLIITHETAERVLDIDVLNKYIKKYLI